MTLKEYMKLNGYNQATMAEALGVRQAQVSYWVSGKRLPGRKLMLKIFEVTKGKVTPNDFFLGDDDND